MEDFLAKKGLNKMDELDRKIINIIQKNGRVSIKKIASDCFISSPAASVRLQNLEQQGLIKNYQAQIDYQKLGYLIKAYVHCAVNAKDKVEFYKYVQQVPNVLECDCITGEYSMQLKVMFQNTILLDEFINQLQRFGDTRTHIVFSTQVESRGLLLADESWETSKN